MPGWYAGLRYRPGSPACIRGRIAAGPTAQDLTPLGGRVFRPGGGNYLVAGFQGLAPYRFEFAAWGALSDRGRVSFRGETAYELLWTQRPISRPALSADIFTSSDRAYRQRGAGLGNVEVRLPTRYEFSRQFAPYAEVRYTRRTPGEEALSRGAGIGAGVGAPASNWTLRGGLWLVF